MKIFNLKVDGETLKKACFINLNILKLSDSFLAMLQTLCKFETTQHIISVKINKKTKSSFIIDWKLKTFKVNLECVKMKLEIYESNESYV